MFDVVGLGAIYRGLLAVNQEIHFVLSITGAYHLPASNNLGILLVRVTPCVGTDRWSLWPAVVTDEYCARAFDSHYIGCHGWPSRLCLAR